MRTTVIAVTSAAAMASAASAGVVLDFADLEFDTNQVHTVGASYIADGYTISKGPNEPLNLLVLGQQHGWYPGQASLFNQNNNGLIIVQRDDESPFSITSIDLAPLVGAAPFSVTFRGYVDDEEVATQTFSHSGQAIALERFFFSDDFMGITRLVWNQDTSEPFHQFTNLAFDILLPAPGVLALLAVAGLVAPRRRRRGAD
jgi:hypothetical protein